MSDEGTDDDDDRRSDDDDSVKKKKKKNNDLKQKFFKRFGGDVVDKGELEDVWEFEEVQKYIRKNKLPPRNKVLNLVDDKVADNIDCRYSDSFRDNVKHNIDRLYRMIVNTNRPVIDSASPSSDVSRYNDPALSRVLEQQRMRYAKYLTYVKDYVDTIPNRGDRLNPVVVMQLLRLCDRYVGDSLIESMVRRNVDKQNRFNKDVRITKIIAVRADEDPDVYSRMLESVEQVKFEKLSDVISWKKRSQIGASVDFLTPVMNVSVQEHDTHLVSIMIFVWDREFERQMRLRSNLDITKRSGGVVVWDNMMDQINIPEDVGTGAETLMLSNGVLDCFLHIVSLLLNNEADYAHGELWEEVRKQFALFLTY